MHALCAGGGGGGGGGGELRSPCIYLVSFPFTFSVTMQQYAPAVVTLLVGTAQFQESVCVDQDGQEEIVTNASLLQPAVSK